MVFAYQTALEAGYNVFLQSTKQVCLLSSIIELMGMLTAHYKRANFPKLSIPPLKPYWWHGQTSHGPIRATWWKSRIRELSYENDVTLIIILL